MKYHLDDNNMPYLPVEQGRVHQINSGGYLMFLKEHIKDIHKFLVFNILIFVIIAIISYICSPKLVDILLTPLLNSDLKVLLVYNKITDLFFLRIIISIYLAISFTFYILMISIAIFLRYSLSKTELVYFISYLILFPLLFSIGVAVAYFSLLPNGLHFLLSYENSFTQRIVANITVVDYLAFVSKMILCCGLVCELPLLIVMLNRFGILQRTLLKRLRRVVIVLSFTIAAIITPPDVMSQVIVAGIMLVLYELSILFCYDKQRN